MRRGLVIALTCLAAFAPAARASHSAPLPDGGVAIFDRFSNVDPPSNPPDWAA